jgi:hypothetical protein
VNLKLSPTCVVALSGKLLLRIEFLILQSEHSDNDAIKSFMGYSSRLLYAKGGNKIYFHNF